MFDVANRIKHFRTKKGLTVNALANLAGISQSYLRDIELGNKTPTVEYLEYICDALKISLVTFFDDSEGSGNFQALFTSLSPQQQSALIDFLKSINS